MTSSPTDAKSIVLPPLDGKLGRIASVLAQRGAGQVVSDDAALDAIAEIVGSRRLSGEVYQKPLG